jgi:hypothetical protein
MGRVAEGIFLKKKKNRDIPVSDANLILYSFSTIYIFEVRNSEI